MLIQVTPKLASETRLTPCDFSPLMSTGQALLSATVTVSVYTGTDLTPPTFTAPTVSGGVIYVQEVAGIAGNIYFVKVVSNLSIPAITYLLAILPDQP